MTDYCDDDYFAQRRSSKVKSFATWEEYTASEDYPDAYALAKALTAATAIMNDRAHLNTATNITTTQDVERLKDICYKITCRILGMELNMGMQGGNWAFSPADYMTVLERQYLVSLARINSKRRVGKVVRG